MASRHMKRCSTSLIIREKQIKTTRRYHLCQMVRMAIIKKSTHSNCWKGCGDRELFDTVDGVVCFFVVELYELFVYFGN